MDNSQSSKRILVLGSAPHGRHVNAYKWEALPPDLNVADYDVVILNFVPFLTERELSQDFPVDRLPTAEQFLRLMFSIGSEIIAIGKPDELIGSGPFVRTDWWLPVKPIVVNEPGIPISVIDPEYKFHFQNVHSWDFFVENSQWPPAWNVGDTVKLIDPRAEGLIDEKHDIAHTRFQRAVAFALRFATVFEKSSRYATGGSEQVIISRSNWVTWLPPTTEISHVEAVTNILRHRYGVVFENSKPVWLDRYKFPDQLIVEEQIAQRTETIQRLEADQAEAYDRLQQITRLRGMLYEQGEDALEPLVRDAFRELGADVSEPNVRGREDGRLIDPYGRPFMLEIKGRTGPLKLEDVRQIDQWVRDAMFQEDWSGKGILIANLDLSNSPQQRGPIFPPNCVTKARIADICLLPTTQLFEALCAYQRNELDLQNFWDTIHGTKGVCPLPEPLPIDPIENSAK